jgi:dipeptidyl aminopeptidase/acylaminoacyl peptidase
VPYFAYDRQSGAATFLFEHQPELSRYPLAAMEPFTYQARDGLTIHGYLTFPPGADRSQLPVVLNVHGGPWVRVSWGFGAEAQWLANRGYLCVQVNYRGTGSVHGRSGSPGPRRRTTGSQGWRRRCLRPTGLPS